MAKSLFFKLEFQGAEATVDQLTKVEFQLDEIAKQLREAKKLGQEDVYKKLRLQQEELRQSSQGLRKELKQQVQDFKTAQYPTTSLIGLEAQYAKLRLEIRSMSEEARKSQDGLAKIKLANQIKAQIDEVNISFRDFKSNIGNYVSAIKLGFADLVTAGLATGGIAATIQAVGNQFTAGFDSVVSYSGKLADLSANSLKTGDELKKLEEAATSLTTITLKNGTEIKNTSEQILTAFKLVGAAKPELLGNAEALKETTKQAIILAQASGDTLDGAVNTIITTLSQYGLEASKAAEVTNILAAGSKAGAAETKDVAASIKEFGLVAANSNISVAESVGLIETLAEKQLKGSEAGTQLRNILVKLSAPDNIPKEAKEGFEQLGVNLKIVSDASLPLEVRLKELSKAQGQSGVLAKAFGTENLQAAQILTENVSSYANFTKQVQGTTVALDQAGIISGSLKTRISNLTAEYNEARKTVVEFMLKGLIPLASMLISIVKGFAAIPQFVRENKEELILLGIALVSFNGQMILATAASLRLAAAEKGRAILTGAVTTAQWLLNAAMNANPIGLIISAVALLSAGFVAVYKRSESFRASIAGLGTLASEIFLVIKEAVSSFVQGFDQVKNGDFTAAFKSFATGVTKANPIGLITQQGKRLGDAFNKGYNDSIKASEAAKVVDKVTTVTPANTVGVGNNNRTFIKPLSIDDQKDAKTEIDKRQKLLEDQVKRIEALNKSIRDLSTKIIDNEFDKQIQEARNKSISELEKTDERLKALQEKIKFQKGVKTQLDVSEEELIKTQTIAIGVALDEQIELIETKRKEAYKQSLDNLKRLQKDNNKLIADLEATDLQERLKQVQINAANEKARLDLQYQLALTSLQEALKSKKITQEAFNVSSGILQQQYNKDVLDLNKSLRERQIDIDNQYLLKRLELLKIERLQALQNVEDQLKDRKKKLEDDLRLGKISSGTFDATTAELEKKAILDKEQLALDFRTKEQIEIQRSKDLQIQANKEVANSNKQVSDDELANLEKARQKRLFLTNSALDFGKALSQGIFDLNKTKDEQEKQENIERLDKELATKLEKVKGNAVLEAAIKKDFEKQKLEIDKKAFEENKKRQIAQALINGALAIVSSLANTALPFPLSLIAPGIIGLTTGFQIANIKAQKFAKGGFTGKAMRGMQADDTGRKPVGIVHEDEYVINDKQVKKYPALLNFLEADRLKSLRGFAEGGFTSPPTLIRSDIFNETKQTVHFDDDQIKELANKVYQASLEGSKEGTYVGSNEGTFKANDSINRSKERQNRFELNNQF